MKIVTLLSLLPFLAFAQTGFNGTFTNTTNGVQAILNISTEYGLLSGTYYEESYDLAVTGTVNGNRMNGELKDIGSGVAFAKIVGELYSDSVISVVLTVQGEERTGLFKRQDVATIMPKPSATRSNANNAADDRKTRDGSIVGTWLYQNVINSGGASLATALQFVLEQNGSYKQYSKGAGGGSDWSYNSGEAELVSQGTWYTESNTLYLKQQGETEYTAAATYKLVDGRLVTEDVNGQKIWSKQ